MPKVTPTGRTIKPKLTSDLIPMAANQEKRATEKFELIIVADANKAE